MKTIIQFCMLLLLVPVMSNATIRTVSNDINKPAQFPDIPQAIAAASNGDTIYVNGTQYTYSDFTVNRKLVIIGAGFNVANQFNLISAVNNIYFFKDAGINDASGSIVTGFKIGLLSLASSTLTITNIKLFRNQIANLDTYPNGVSSWSIYNNIVTGLINGRNGSNNIVIQNNIFYGGGFVANFNQPSVVVDHNLFINVNNSLSGLQFSIVTNNVFTSSSGTQVMASVTQSTFNNNLSLSTNISPVSPTNNFLSGNNTGGGNQVGVNPLFVSVSDLNNYNTAFNYRLQSGSTGHLAGTDGTDLGIYGGSYPFPSGGTPGGGYDTSPLPPIPQINSVNIQNASVLPGAQLQVNVQATVNN
jgi:hypothetical protein